MKEGGEAHAELRSARRRVLWATLASMVLFAPVAAALVGKAPTENRPVGGWLTLSVVMLVSHLTVLFRLERHPDAVGGGLAVGAGWLNTLVIGLFFLTPTGQYSALVALGVPAVGVWILAYVLGLLAAQRVMILSGGVMQRAAVEGREARHAERAVMVPVTSMLLLGAVWLGVVVTKDLARQHQRLAQERVRAAQRAATHPAPPPLERRWEVQLMPAPRNPSMATPPVVGPDGTIYVALDTALVAVTPSGEVKWRNPVVQSLSLSAVVGRDGRIYVGGRTGTLYAVRPDGTVEWAVPMPVPNANFPSLPRPSVGVDGTIYVGATFSGYDRPKNSPLTAVSPNGTVRWRVDMGRGLNDAIIPTSDGGVYVLGNGDVSEVLVRLDANGTIRLRRALPPGRSGPRGPVAAPNGTIYIARDSAIVAVTPPDSTIRRIESGNRYMNAMLVGDDGTLFTDSATTIRAHGSDGRKRWTHDLARLADTEGVQGLVLGGDGRLIVSTQHRVVVLDPDDGRELADYAPTIDRGNRPSAPRLHGPSPAAVAADGTIYVVDSSYRLYALRPR